tara:strand:- start:294 stop:512 length:219 start_codon:yes stop_codon:yes gene_type:complete
MDTQKVRAILAITVVSGVLFICALLVLLPLIGGVQNASQYTSVLKEFSGIFSGIVGTIIGYYFGKSGSTDSG